MSSIKLNTLINEFPEEALAIDRLAKLIDEVEAKQEVREISPQRLFDVMMPSNQRVLLKILSRASDFGYLRRVIRVESRAYGGIGDFDSVLDIPTTLLDTRLGLEIEVEIDQIKLIYVIE